MTERYRPPAGPAFEDVSITTANLHSGVLAQRFDPVAFPREGQRVPSPTRSLNLAWLASQHDVPAAVFASFGQPYNSAYTGPVSGRLAGASNPALYDVAVYSTTDADYLQGTFPVQANGTWSSGAQTIFPGTKSLRVLLRSTGAVQVQGRVRGLINSFIIPANDPALPFLGTRCYVYNGALAVLAYCQAGDFARAKDLLTAMAALQHPDGGVPTSANVLTGVEASTEVRSGALAWVGLAAVAYERASGDNSLRTFTTKMADHLLGLQQASGSVTGGGGATFSSTEHNIDAFFFLTNLANLIGSSRYAAAAQRISDSLLGNHWNAAEGRFNQGIGDDALALDCFSWGGLFLLAVGQVDLARQVAFKMEQIFRTTDQGVAGYRPYGRGYVNPPDLVWAEGTWGALLLRQRLGQDITRDMAALSSLQSSDGSMLMVTTEAPAEPFEFHRWPATAAVAWSALVRSGGFSVLEFN